MVASMVDQRVGHLVDALADLTAELLVVRKACWSADKKVSMMVVLMVGELVAKTGFDSAD